MSGWLASWLGVRPRGAKIPTSIRTFSSADQTLSRDGIVVEGSGWLVDAHERQVVRLFEVPDPEVENCLLIYRAAMRSEDLEGRAFLEMWCRLPGRGEFFSRGSARPLRRTVDWSSYEILFRLKKGQRPDLIKLDLVVEGRGKVWIRDIELLKTPRK